MMMCCKNEIEFIYILNIYFEFVYFINIWVEFKLYYLFSL